MEAKVGPPTPAPEAAPVAPKPIEAFRAKPVDARIDAMDFLSQTVARDVQKLTASGASKLSKPLENFSKLTPGQPTKLEVAAMTYEGDVGDPQVQSAILESRINLISTLSDMSLDNIDPSSPEWAVINKAKIAMEFFSADAPDGGLRFHGDGKSYTLEEYDHGALTPKARSEGVWRFEKVSKEAVPEPRSVDEVITDELESIPKQIADAQEQRDKIHKKIREVRNAKKPKEEKQEEIERLRIEARKYSREKISQLQERLVMMQLAELAKGDYGPAARQMLFEAARAKGAAIADDEMPQIPVDRDGIPLTLPRALRGAGIDIKKISLDDLPKLLMDPKYMLDPKYKDRLQAGIFGQDIDKNVVDKIRTLVDPHNKEFYKKLAKSGGGIFLMLSLILGKEFFDDVIAQPIAA